MMSFQDIIDYELNKSYSSSKFMFSPAGILKIVAIISYFVGSILFLSLQICPGTASWYGILFPIVMIIAGVLVTTLYIIFATGLAKKSFMTWNMIDMSTTTLIFVLSIVIGVVTITQCSSSKLTYFIAPPIGILGSICLAISTTIIFMKWRTKKDEFEEHERQMRERAKRPTLNPATFRKSVIV